MRPFSDQSKETAAKKKVTLLDRISTKEEKKREQLPVEEDILTGVRSKGRK